MKLFTKYNRINLLSSVAIFLLASFAFYFLLRYVLIKQVDDDLEIEQHEIELYVAKYQQLPEALPVRDQQIDFTPAKDNDGKRKFSTVSCHQLKGASRQLVFFIAVKNEWYKVSVSKSLRSTNNITRSIILISLSTILIMLIASFVINRLLLRKLWKPFYQSLASMKAFRLGYVKPVFDTTNIDEFNTLNKTLEQAVSNAENEYQRLKEFTENASHELQTPLAVIRSKLDVLIQDEQLSASQSLTVQSAYDAVNKLARLNQSLLLLSKIENRQFSDKTLFNFKEIVEQKIIAFKEIWEEKKFNLEISLKDCNVSMNSTLAELMLNNLFSNAVRHTSKGGTIRITLSATELIISNSAVSGALDNNKLFDRFYKGGQASDNQGLGLSIVQQICVVSGCVVHYKFVNYEHQFTVSFHK